ncbi:AraC-like ligand-binding domain-containing protein [Neokomagataea anthophila]|uniref:Helix-turn-helix domain-containing protein n=1 Tax=Neokomagataea anthophila TaxID=2826925 RepID=A0ABS5E7I8_9PROT|nr:helix-turn-helix domain-containing protein [Neokomagataea anthophila]MBR0559836.1 helix-turn-helix domain-containing protein [Neokomagataea anthophila]
MSSRLQTYGTEGLSQHAQKECWHDIITRSFVPLECSLKTNNFQGHITRLSLDTCSISKVCSSAQSVTRTSKLTQKAENSYYLLSLGIKGLGEVQQDGRQAILKPGTFALYDSRRPYTLNFDHKFEQIVFMMPSIALNSCLGYAENLTATTIDTTNPLHEITANFLSQLLNTTQDLPSILVNRIATQTSEIVASMLIATMDHSPAQTSHRLAMGLQLRAAIEKQLHDPKLSRQSLAQQFRISTRYLDDLFSDEGIGPAEYILQKRLQWAHKALSDPARSRYQIGEIARMSGFISQSHFSRVFSSTFKQSPREYRQHCLIQHIIK